jgi:hypothetical protein
MLIFHQGADQSTDILDQVANLWKPGEATIFFPPFWNFVKTLRTVFSVQLQWDWM